jgi:hypothetical protein
MGGLSIVVFGLIAVAGANIWVDNKVNFSDNKNLLVAAITLVLGTGDYSSSSAASRWAASVPPPSARSCFTPCSTARGKSRRLILKTDPRGGFFMGGVWAQAAQVKAVGQNAAGTRRGMPGRRRPSPLAADRNARPK